MSTLSVVWNGNRYAVKVTPMMAMSAAVEDVCKQAGLQCQLSDCSLKHGKQAVDLCLPFRFTNIPSGSKLELQVAGAPSIQLGFRETSQPDSVHATDVRVNPDGATLAPAPVTPWVPAAIASTAVPLNHGSAGTALACPAPEEEGSLTGAEAIVGRPFHLFLQDDLAGALHGRDEDESDAFFQMTPGDYYALMAGAKAKAFKDGMLMTQAMRDAEAARKAEQIGPVRIRIILPDRLILQASFKATDKLSDLMDFMRRCIEPGTARWYLYTTPPKQVIEDTTLTLFQAGLIPAAKLYLGLESKVDKSLLRSEVLAHKAAPPVVQERPPSDKAVEEALSASTVATLSAEATRGITGEAREAKGKKAPKWLKIGK